MIDNSLEAKGFKVNLLNLQTYCDWEWDDEKNLFKLFYELKDNYRV